MSQMFAPRFLLVASLALVLTGCSSAPVDRLPRPSGTAPVVIDPGSDLYSDTSGAMVELDTALSDDDSQSNSEDSSSALDKDLCDRVGKLAIEYSKIAAEETGAVYIARVLEGKVIVDNRETIGEPKAGTALVRIECLTTIALSNGEPGTLNIYELLDSDGKLRIRWDNYTPN